MMKTFAVALLLVTALLRIDPVQSSSHLDDEVPTEKAAKPKLKPPTQLPEVTHRVYLDVGEKKSTYDIIYSIAHILFTKASSIHSLT